jgi:hypothetical protein
MEQSTCVRTKSRAVTSQSTSRRSIMLHDRRPLFQPAGLGCQKLSMGPAIIASQGSRLGSAGATKSPIKNGQKPKRGSGTLALGKATGRLEQEWNQGSKSGGTASAHKARSHGLGRPDPITRLRWPDDRCGCQAKAQRGLHMPRRRESLFLEHDFWVPSCC